MRTSKNESKSTMGFVMWIPPTSQHRIQKFSAPIRTNKGNFWIRWFDWI